MIDEEQTARAVNFITALSLASLHPRPVYLTVVDLMRYTSGAGWDKSIAQTPETELDQNSWNLAAFAAMNGWGTTNLYTGLIRGNGGPYPLGDVANKAFLSKKVGVKLVALFDPNEGDTVAKLAESQIFPYLSGVATDFSLQHFLTTKRDFDVLLTTSMLSVSTLAFSGRGIEKNVDVEISRELAHDQRTAAHEILAKEKDLKSDGLMEKISSLSLTRRLYIVTGTVPNSAQETLTKMKLSGPADPVEIGGVRYEPNEKINLRILAGILSRDSSSKNATLYKRFLEDELPRKTKASKPETKARVAQQNLDLLFQGGF